MVQCLNFLEKIMSIKQRIKFKQVDRDRGTHSAKGVSLDLSDDAQASDDSRRLKARVPFAAESL